MTPGAVRPEAAAEIRTHRLVDFGSGEPRSVTTSRAVHPPVTVRNKRLTDSSGEACLVWRCLECGSLGSLDFLPTRCVCGARREALEYVVED